MTALGSHISYLEQLYTDCVTSSGLELPNLEIDEFAELTHARSPQEVKEFADYFNHLTKKTTYLEDCYDTYVDRYDYRVALVDVLESTKARQRQIWTLASIAFGQSNIQHPEVHMHGPSSSAIREIGIVYRQLKMLLGGQITALQSKGVVSTYIDREHVTIDVEGQELPTLRAKITSPFEGGKKDVEERKVYDKNFGYGFNPGLTKQL